MLNQIITNKNYGSYNSVYRRNKFTNYLVNIFVKAGFGLNNQQWFICYKTKSKQITYI